MENLDDAFVNEEKEGRAKVADNGDDIARYIGCDPEVLKNNLLTDLKV